MSRNLKGFGPQSTTFDLSTSAQWSEICLSKTYCLLPGQCCNQSKVVKNLSSLLLALPLGLYQVNFVPIQDKSTISILSMKLLKPCTSRLIPLGQFIPLHSLSFLTELKSPRTHQELQCSLCLISNKSAHICLFTCIIHEEYTFTIITRIFFSLARLINTMNHLSMMWLVHCKNFLCHIVRIPPAPFDGSL